MFSERNWQQKRQLIAEAIAAVAKKFTEEPASFLSERDVQSFLFYELFSRFDENEYKQSRKEKHEHMHVFSKGEFLVNPVKTEYRARGTPPIDIVILSEDDDKDWWRIPIRVGIEIKLRQDRRNLSALALGDFQKLTRYAKESAGSKFTGLCLLFSHIQPSGDLDIENSNLEGRSILVNPPLNAIVDQIHENAVSILAFTHSLGDRW